MSKDEASTVAASVAERLLKVSDLKGWIYRLGAAKPDPIDTETIRKVPRFWVCCVEIENTEGSIFDGGGFIRVDLQNETAEWDECP